jgi:hypothetical protein
MNMPLNTNTANNSLFDIYQQNTGKFNSTSVQIWAHQGLPFLAVKCDTQPPENEPLLQ